jgi:putative molybdopterin biosynthesis protein
MVEHTEPAANGILVSRPAVPGGNITFAGSDIGRGEVVMRRGALLSSRETGVLAAVGVETIQVYAAPAVSVVSTGDEIVAPGKPLAVGQVFDSNQRILLDAVAEIGCTPVPGGIFPDDLEQLEAAVERLVVGPEAVDVVLMSGGTSKGDGDINAAVVARLAARLPDSAGIVVHGVALKPGKPILMALIAGTPVVVLPGFPTSAIFTFHEFVAPLLRRLTGAPEDAVRAVEAVAPIRIDSVSGRTQYALVDLVEGVEGLAAYPLGAGSGSVTAFARADGFIRIPSTTEYIEQGAMVTVRLIDPDVRPADLVAIGSHCVGLDHLLSLLAGRGYRIKAVPLGSTAGIAALARGEGDIAGIHLLDAGRGTYNRSFLPPGVQLLRGYGRRQGIASRRDNPVPATSMLGSSGLRMVNRNPGSGTRILIDSLLDGAQPDGYLHQPKTHYAVAAAVAQGRADWGMTLDTIAERAGLEFTFVADERYDIAVRDDRLERPAIVALRDLLADAEVRHDLEAMGFAE